jgi:hypothetical protein
MRVWAVFVSMAALGCSDVLDLCTPKRARFDFFSKGDCMLTRASFFQGHEWLTFLGNEDLPREERFTRSEIEAVAEGNRRMDWPKELLLHMNNGLLAYIAALEEHTERPENQRLHFLLTDRNTSEEAARDSREEIRRVTREALAVWRQQPLRALTLLGQANHIMQDAYSAAHTKRDRLHPERPWCIVKVKAYIERADGHHTDDIEFHGSGEDQAIGHTTPEDSPYRAGRDCHEPATRNAVEACLSETARKAREATRDYHALVQRTRRFAAPDPSRLDELLTIELDGEGGFFEKHLSMCP